jgi:outer membrane protein assembly factor BamB
MNPGTTGGDWPRSGNYSWLPFVMNQPAQHIPVVLPLNAGPRVILASQDGHVYSVNAGTGDVVWTSPQLGETLQASPVGFFSDFVAGAPDLLFVGTRNTTAANELVALSPATGVEIAAKTFTNSSAQGGDDRAIGIINGVMGSYGNWKVYFTTRARTGGSPGTVWCVDASGTGITKSWSREDLGDIDGSPVVYQGRVYVGTNGGWVYALDAATGATMWSWNTGTGEPIKGYVTPHWGASPLRLYLSTSSKVWAINDGASSPTWSITANAPSVPLLRYGTTTLYYGDGAGVLHQVDTSTGAQTNLTLAAGVALGAPTYDNVSGMIHVGSTAGIVYGVAVPF